MLQGAKYKRRWVEITADTMVYAPSQQDALTGQIQVFAIADMVWVKPAADTKFLVSNPTPAGCYSAPPQQQEGSRAATKPTSSRRLLWTLFASLLCLHLQVKFPERTLKFKVAAGGQEEREQWVAALHNARKINEAARQERNSGAGKLEQLQKVCLLWQVAAEAS